MFFLQWDEYESKITEGLKDLRERKELFDVTLVTDGDEVQAHKVLLASCSPRFRQMLKETQDQHPRFDLSHVQFKYVLSMVEFMYNGEIKIAQNDVNPFYAATDEFLVKGLYVDPEDMRKVSFKSEPKDEPEEDETAASNSTVTPGDAAIVTATTGIEATSPPASEEHNLHHTCHNQDSSPHQCGQTNTSNVNTDTTQTDIIIAMFSILRDANATVTPTVQEVEKTPSPMPTVEETPSPTPTVEETPSPTPTVEETPSPT